MKEAKLVCLAAGLRSDPLGGELTVLARQREQVLKKIKQKKERMRKNKGKKKAL